ncbi:MAG: tRNA (guanosine(37)-N1)-methyltransferase TrmD [Pleurocapsa minor GSE-CHR-MK-17-07R]|nr:tRNA (guanosine(37)-N1)-methyltransferase TrmD [Pleurocapsa minor GSE-CHR-MK 17-07R]
MRIDILTLFPEMFQGPMTESMLWKARDRGILDLRLHNIRDFSQTRHKNVDDTPYGGGGGMVMKPDVVARAIESITYEAAPGTPVILMTPRGRVFNHQTAVDLAGHEQVVLLCGHYEGIDERVSQLLVTDELSIGDYVLTGGELAAMVVVDAVIRHLPGVLGAEGGAERESHADGILEGPHYTRPAEFRGLTVPAVLTSGDHGAILRWRRKEGLRQTWLRRPDLLLTARLTLEEQYWLTEFANETARQSR